MNACDFNDIRSKITSARIYIHNKGGDSHPVHNGRQLCHEKAMTQRVDKRLIKSNEEHPLHKSFKVLND